MSNKKPKKVKKLTEDEIKRQLELQKIQEDKKLQEEIDQEKASLLNLIVEQANARTSSNKKNKNSKDELLKKYLVSVGVGSVDEQNKIIAQIKQPYRPHFQYEKGYYKEIFRLNSWDEDESEKFNKPREVAVWTVRLIYGRFMKALPEVIEILRSKNKYVGFCVRRYKFFQFLTPEAQRVLDDYIDDCIAMMKQFNDWYAFEKAYCIKHGLAYQKNLFDES